jgi:hypothetical protein
MWSCDAMNMRLLAPAILRMERGCSSVMIMCMISRGRSSSRGLLGGSLRAFWVPSMCLAAHRRLVVATDRGGGVSDRASIFLRRGPPGLFSSFFFTSRLLFFSTFRKTAFL